MIPYGAGDAAEKTFVRKCCLLCRKRNSKDYLKYQGRSKYVIKRTFEQIYKKGIIKPGKES